MSARGGRGGRGARNGNNHTRSGGRRGHGQAHNSNNSNNNERPAQAIYTPRGPAGQRGPRSGGSHGGADTRGAPNVRDDARGPVGNTNPFASKPTGAQNTTPHGSEDYKMRLARIKAARPLQREQFIKRRLMNPDGQMRLCDSVKLIGICTDMCPEFERVRRIVENDVKPPECTPETEHLLRGQRIPDESRMVKAYARSAAGMDVELVSELRSPATCLKTISYLFDRLDHDDFQYLQSWIWDRTRAVRKDLRTQRIEKKPDINILLTCLEQIARFHLLSMHHMARSTKQDYTHQQDFEQLNQTMMSLKERYVDNRRANIPTENEAEFLAYRLILAPQYASDQLENELHGLPSHLRHNTRVKTAIEIYRLLKSVLITRRTSFVQCQANWKKLWELIKCQKVSYLMACAAEISFNRVRHVVLDGIWRAYRVGNAKNIMVVETWTTDKLKDALGLDSDQEAVKLCENFGFEFSLNADGQTFLDITKMGYAHRVLAKPNEDKPQIFSAKLVEIKRHDRALSAVIRGMSVQQAKGSGLLVEAESGTEAEVEMEDENSLFIPESSTANTKISSQQPNGIAPAASTFGANTPFNPFASPFQSGSLPVAAPNPFLKAVPQSQPNQTTPTSITPNVHPGIFDASTNSVQLAPFGGAAYTPVSSHSNGVSAPANPFLKGVSAPSVPQANPFARFGTPNSQGPAATATPPSAAPFTFSGLTPNINASQGSAQPELSSTPTGPPPPQVMASQDVARQKAEQQRREAEARTRAQEAQRARAAQEAEQRQRQAEAEAAQARQRQLQADQERRAREAQEKLIRETQQRQALEEEAQRARIRKRDSAWQSLTMDIMFDPEEGLMLQYIQNAVLNITQEVMVEEQKRHEENLAAEMRERRRLALARVVMARWIGIIEKRKKAEQARNRRKRIKEQRARMANMEEVELHTAPTPTDSATTVDQPKSDQAKSGSTFQRPAVPANARRAKRTKERREGLASQVNGGSRTISYVNGSAQTTPVNMTNGATSITGYSQTYQRSTAPIDRTETDWFKLRAMGIDPSKQRKRSFDSTSDEEEQTVMEPKRPKLSPPMAHSRKLPTPPTTADDQRARFRAVQQLFNKSGTSPPQAVNGASSINGVTSGGRSDFGTKSSHLITKARKLVANSPPDVQHDWGRSVPNLGFSGSISSGSALGKSAGAPNANDRPAYWARTSRFVPRHLYGQGPEAIRAFNDQYAKRRSSNSGGPVSTEPLAQSSPIPTQQSYIPQPGYSQKHTHQQYNEEEDADGVEAVDTSAEDEDSVMTEESEVEEHEDSEMADTEEEADDEDEEGFAPTHFGQGYVKVQGEEKNDEEYTEEEAGSPQPQQQQQQHDQPPARRVQQPATQQSAKKAPPPAKQGGTTEDDAIELSD